MIPLDPPFRLAMEADAPQLAELVNQAGHGLPLHIWTVLADEGGDPWEVGRARQAQKARDGNVVVVDPGHGPVACLIGYGIDMKPEPIGEDVPKLLRPLLELENRALDSWHVNVLACDPEHRGQGIGSRLLELAEEIARSDCFARMSVITADGNHGARRLYTRHGYEQIDTLPSVTGEWETETENWVLLMKRL